MGKEDQVTLDERVRIEFRDGVAVLSIENPPAAALSGDVRAAFLNALDTVESSEAAGIVITGSQTAFATGAGVSETVDDATPDLAELCDRVEALEKPVVVAIRGPALGGGLELALAAHLRIAAPTARLGAPDITLGLVPNAGGTQRLPKIIGGVAALKLLLSGRAVSGETALKLGLVDHLDAADPVGLAVTWATRLAKDTSVLQRSSLRRDRLGEGTAFLEAVSAHRAAADATPLDAPIRLIECVEAALLLPYDIGRGLEQAAYEDLVQSEHSKSLRYVFAAERQLKAATDWEGRVASRTMSGVTVVGARSLAAEVSVQCLDAGFHVTVADVNEEAMEDGVGRIIGHFDARVAAGSMTEDAVEQVLDRMQAVPGYDHVGNADVVIDPLPNLTRSRVDEVDAAMKAGAILVLGGEGVDIGTVARTTGRAADVVGMRFFPGVRKNRLVELAVTDDTGPRAVSTARALARKLDRLIVEVAPSRLAIGTQILEALHAAADLCLEDGASLQQIDAALKDWGLPFGSFGWRDLTGIKRQSAPSGLEGVRGGGIDPVLVSTGRLGLATGRGYYTYERRGSAGVVDPEIEKMIDADRAAKETEPQNLSDGDIRVRCVAAMAGAGAEALDQGIAKRAEDIDMVAVHGLGFARRTGGVMFAADLVGLTRVADVLGKMAAVTNRLAAPSRTLKSLGESDGKFTGGDPG